MITDPQLVSDSDLCADCALLQKTIEFRLSDEFTGLCPMAV
jgi:hypothetical protein